MKLDIHLHWPEGRELIGLIRSIYDEVTVMSIELERLTTEVAETNTVIDSAIALIQGIKKRLDDAIAAGNPAALTELSDALDSKQQELADAIVTNTPAE